jgi:hypothetical protein
MNECCLPLICAENSFCGTLECLVGMISMNVREKGMSNSVIINLGEQNVTAQFIRYYAIYRNFYLFGMLGRQ